MNRERDYRNAEELKRQGWRVITLWKCQLTADQVRIAEFFECEIIAKFS
jgi:G:T-mismatch repair DNA endonuclease (very short patch repair protein)